MKLIDGLKVATGRILTSIDLEKAHNGASVSENDSRGKSTTTYRMGDEKLTISTKNFRCVKHGRGIYVCPKIGPYVESCRLEEISERILEYTTDGRMVSRTTCYPSGTTIRINYDPPGRFFGKLV